MLMIEQNASLRPGTFQYAMKQWVLFGQYVTDCPEHNFKIYRRRLDLYLNRYGNRKGN